MAAISLLVAALALVASLVPVPAAMAGPAPFVVEGWYQALEKSEARDALDIAIHVMHKHLEELPSLVHGDGNQGESRSGGAARGGAIISVSTGSHKFPVTAVDITAPLTSTSMCDTSTGRPVPCSSTSACSTMAPCGQPLCASSPIHPTCTNGTTSTVLYQGPITLVSASVTALGSTVYACRVGASSSGMEAVLGLSWRGAQSLGLHWFSYSVSSSGKISVSVGTGGGHAAVVRGSGSTGTTALLSNPNPRNHPDLYYVRVTGIEVGEDPQQVLFLRGALDLRQDGSGGGVFLSTTMPLTLLNGGVYDSLIRTLKASMPAASIITRSELSPRQLCYRSGTQTPTITLVLDDGAAAMKLPVESCWYKQPSDASACLAILPSPWPTGESLLGTMAQSGRRMTYDLAARTLTFQSSSSPPPPSAVLPNSSRVLWALLLAAAAHVAFTFL